MPILTLEGFIVASGFDLTYFELGYTLCNQSHKNNRPHPVNLGDYFNQSIYWANRLSATPGQVAPSQRNIQC